MFKPFFSITESIAQTLVELESLRHELNDLPITPTVLMSLRQTAQLQSTHYSTMIEGNRLTQEEIDQLLTTQQPIIGRERDQQEVLGYYAALAMVEKQAQANRPITENSIQKIHALVMGGGKKTVKLTPYRDGQNVIKDGQTRAIVYMPPEAKDVPNLMQDLIAWLTASTLPCPLQAAIAHYQYATIHPYYDGNGRTARLLATLTLHLGGYDLKGIYSLDEYYAKNLSTYYKALTVGPSHNYYLGRAEADITPWLEYFCTGMLASFQAVKKHAMQAQADQAVDQSAALKMLDARQRKALSSFAPTDAISSQDIAKLFKLNVRSARHLCQQWAGEGFLIIADASKKRRLYMLNSKAY